jgi:hypothetical protein
MKWACLGASACEPQAVSKPLREHASGRDAPQGQSVAGTRGGGLSGREFGSHGGLLDVRVSLGDDAGGNSRGPRERYTLQRVL